MEHKNYNDRAWELGYYTLEMVHRMSHSEFLTLGEAMLKTAKQVSDGVELTTQEEM